MDKITQAKIILAYIVKFPMALIPHTNLFKRVFALSYALDRRHLQLLHDSIANNIKRAEQNRDIIARGIGDNWYALLLKQLDEELTLEKELAEILDWAEIEIATEHMNTWLPTDEDDNPDEEYFEPKPVEYYNNWDINDEGNIQELLGIY